MMDDEENDEEMFMQEEAGEVAEEGQDDGRMELVEEESNRDNILDRLHNAKAVPAASSSSSKKSETPKSLTLKVLKEIILPALYPDDIPTEEDAIRHESTNFTYEDAQKKAVNEAFAAKGPTWSAYILTHQGKIQAAVREYFRNSAEAAAGTSVPYKSFSQKFVENEIIPVIYGDNPPSKDIMTQQRDSWEYTNDRQDVVVAAMAAKDGAWTQFYNTNIM